MNLDVLAGKMSFDGKKVSPDNRKGILRLVIDSASDSVTLQWLDRSVDPPVVENSWSAPVGIEEVPSVKTGKVYVVKPLGGDKQFIWIQQSSAEALVNQIQMFAQISSAREAMEMHQEVFEDDEVRSDQMLVDLGHHHDEDDEEDEDVEALVEQLMEQIGDDASEDDIIRVLLSNPSIMGACLVFYLETLCLMIKNKLISIPEKEKPVSVTKVIQSGIPHLLPKHAERLTALCPDSDLEGILKSPQFIESMRSLNEGIYSDQLGALFASLGLAMPPSVDTDPFEALCKALEDKYSKK